jgi:hypothetical protein
MGRAFGSITSVALAAALALTLGAGPAFAKGPRKAVVTGPGLGRPVTLRNEAPFVFFESRGGGRLGRLTHRPDGPLGPRYTITYPEVWGPHSGKVIEYVFPYAQPRPVSYTPPNQSAMPLFPSYSWRAPYPSFARTFLTALGLPAKQAEAAPTAVTATITQHHSALPSVTLAWLPVGLTVGVAMLVSFRSRRRRILGPRSPQANQAKAGP